MRDITEEERRHYDRHGVVHLPGLLGEGWIKRLEAAFTDNSPSQPGSGYHSPSCSTMEVTDHPPGTCMQQQPRTAVFNRSTIVERIAADEFAVQLGVRLLEYGRDSAVIELPYRSELGIGRIHGGAISALVDIAATAAFWSSPDVTIKSQGATVGFTINFLRQAVATDLRAVATVRRRGGTLCTGDVIVRDAHGSEVALAIVTYKLTGYRSNRAGEPEQE